MKFESPTEQLFFTTTRIECSLAKNKTSAGTGFGVIYQKDGKDYPFLVTNKHVIQGASSGKFFFTEGRNQEPQIGERIDINMEAFESRWYGHPSAEIDIAVMPSNYVIERIRQEIQKEVFLRHFPLSLIPDAKKLEELDAIEVVIFVGYPQGIYDSKNLIPVARRGTTATPPQIDYEGRPIFLIDASVFEGSSGSPVLICNVGGFSTKQGFATGTQVYLLGVLSQVIKKVDQSAVEFVEIPTTQIPVAKSQQYLDIGVVIKATTIVETIESFLSMASSASSTTSFFI